MRRSELRMIIREEVARSERATARRKKVNEILSEQQLNEDVLTIAGGVVLGLLGFMATAGVVKAGAKAAIRWADNKTDEMERAKRMAVQASRNEKYVDAVESIAQKFADDSTLNGMLEQLSKLPYTNASGAKAEKQRKERGTLLRKISSHVKSKLEPNEAKLIKGVLRSLRGEELIR